jgi:hypothetical protein
VAIATSDEELVRAYVDRSFRWLERKSLNIWPGTPPKTMWAGDRNSEGWRPWHLVPSTVTEADLDGLEAELGLQFPPIYRCFLEYMHFVDLAAFGLDFERHLPEEWQARLRDLYRAFDPQRIVNIGLLPFGSERLADAGLVCFDTRRRRPDGDAPVVIWDHEWVETEKEIVPLYSSARKLFECQLFFVESEIDIHNWEETEPTRAHRAVVEEMLAIDPEGLGGPGRRWLASFFPHLVST